MSSVIRQETAVFLIFILHGAALTFLYDILRALRRCFRHGLLSLSIEDFLFWLTAGFLTFYLAFRKSDGIIRGYAAVGILIGFLLYRLTLGPLAMAGLIRLFGLLLKMAAFVRHSLQIAFRVLLRIIRMVIHLVRQCMRGIFCPARRCLRIAFRPLRRILSIPVRKTCGFCKKKTVLKKTCRFHKKRIEFTRKNDYNISNDRAHTERLRKIRGVHRKGVNENGRS